MLLLDEECVRILRKGKIVDSFWKPLVQHSLGPEQVLNKYLLIDPSGIVTSSHTPEYKGNLERCVQNYQAAISAFGLQVSVGTAPGMNVTLLLLSLVLVFEASH